MIVQNNLTPVVILILIVLFFCVLFGVIIGNEGLFGPGQPARATQAAMNAQATQDIIHVNQTPQAIYVEQTVIAADLTRMPLAQTATAVYSAAEQQNATLTTVAGETYLNGVAVAATATAIAENQRKRSATTNAGIGLVVIVGVTFCIWILSRAVVNMLDANARRNITQATALDKQRQLAQFRASHQKAPGPIVQPSIPTYLMEERGNGHKKSTAG